MRLLQFIGGQIQNIASLIHNRLLRLKHPQTKGTADSSRVKEGLDQTRLRQETGSTLQRMPSPVFRTILRLGRTEPNCLTLRRQRNRTLIQPVQTRWLFTVVSGVDYGRQYMGITREIRVGRQPENHIQLRDPKVSRLHAVIHCRGSVLILEDHHSTNGTWINGRRIFRKRLYPGDLIRVGETEIRVVQQK